MIGSAGVLEIRDGGKRVECITATSGPRDVPLPRPRAFFADFIAELRGGSGHILSGEEPFEMTRVALMARESAETGKVMEL